MTECRLTPVSCGRAVEKIKEDQIYRVHFYLAHSYMARRALVTIGAIYKSLPVENSVFGLLGDLGDDADFEILVDALKDFDCQDRLSHRFLFLDIAMHIAHAMNPSYSGNPMDTPDVFRMLLRATTATAAVMTALQKLFKASNEDNVLARDWASFESAFLETPLGDRLAATQDYHGEKAWLLDWMRAEYNATMITNMETISLDGTFNAFK